MAIWHSFRDLLARSVKSPRLARRPIGQAKPAGRDQRRSVRNSQRFVEGFIWSERMAASKACAIRDLSVTGARIELLNGGVNPHTLRGLLTLYLPAEKREIDCKLMWRAGGSIGLEFVGPYLPPSRQYGSRRA